MFNQIYILFLLQFSKTQNMFLIALLLILSFKYNVLFCEGALQNKEILKESMQEGNPYAILDRVIGYTVISLGVYLVWYGMSYLFHSPLVMDVPNFTSVVDISVPIDPKIMEKVQELLINESLELPEVIIETVANPQQDKDLFDFLLIWAKLGKE